jgi:hypothetical protein
MKLYKDRELKEEIEILNLGIVEAGEVASFTYYVYNETQAEMKTLLFKVDHPEVKVINAPKELATKAIAELIIQWSPSITLRQGLKARLNISGIELWS